MKHKGSKAKSMKGRTGGGKFAPGLHAGKVGNNNARKSGRGKKK